MNPLIVILPTIITALVALPVFLERPRATSNTQELEAPYAATYAIAYTGGASLHR